MGGCGAAASAPPVATPLPQSLNCHITLLESRAEKGPQRLAPLEGAGFLSQACHTSFCAPGHMTDPSPFNCRGQMARSSHRSRGRKNTQCPDLLTWSPHPRAPEPRKRLTAQRLLCCIFPCVAALRTLLTLSHQGADAGARNCEHTVFGPRQKTGLCRKVGRAGLTWSGSRVPGRRWASSLPCWQPPSQDVLCPVHHGSAWTACPLKQSLGLNDSGRKSTWIPRQLQSPRAPLLNMNAVNLTVFIMNVQLEKFLKHLGTHCSKFHALVQSAFPPRDVKQVIQSLGPHLTFFNLPLNGFSCFRKYILIFIQQISIEFSGIISQEEI